MVRARRKAEGGIPAMMGRTGQARGSTPEGQQEQGGREEGGRRMEETGKGKERVATTRAGERRVKQKRKEITPTPRKQPPLPG